MSVLTIAKPHTSNPLQHRWTQAHALGTLLGFPESKPKTKPSHDIHKLTLPGICASHSRHMCLAASTRNASTFRSLAVELSQVIRVLPTNGSVWLRSGRCAILGYGEGCGYAAETQAVTRFKYQQANISCACYDRAYLS